MKAIWAITVCVIGLGLAGCGPTSAPTETQADQSAPASTAPPPPPPSPSDLETQLRPAAQVQLEKLAKAVDDAEMPSGNAINDKDNFMKAYQAFCTAMQNTTGVQMGWTARVDGLYPGDPNSDISKKPSMSLETPGGLKVFTDLEDGSDLMKVARTLKENDYVQFSINVTHLEEDGQPYNECHDPDYDSPKGPLVNKFLTGKIVSITPIGQKG